MRALRRGAMLPFILLAFVLATPCFAQSKPEDPSKQTDSLKSFLQTNAPKPDSNIEQQGETRYSSALVDLKDDGTKETIVYLTGRDWCGSGGCVMLILVPEGKSFRIVTETTVTRLPIRVLESKSNGWHDISVVVAGGGIQPGYEAILSYDGETYPTNPTVPPARQSNQKTRGKTVIPTKASDQPLYP